MKIRGYLGTYTRNASKGIYSFILDTNEGKVTEPTLVAELTDPTYLTIHKNYLFANFKAEGKGAVRSFVINQENGGLLPSSTSTSENGTYCHLSVCDNLIVTANYGNGIVETFPLNDYQIGPIIDTIQHSGSGPNPDRQQAAHAHYSGFTPDGNYIVVVDLGIDKIITYEETEGKLKELASLAVKPGSGPRHLVFHPTKPVAYCIAELRPEVIVLSYNNGRFTVVETVRSIPLDYLDNNQGSAIHISSDGRFVYAANRGHNSIAVFSVHEDGTLTLLENVSTYGDWPRDFSIDPTGRYIVVSNEESDNLTLFHRDENSGRLTFIQKNIHVPTPVCVKFARF